MNYFYENLKLILKTIVVLSNYNRFAFYLYHFIKNYSCYNFNKHNIKKDTILITDAVETHGEVLPGLIKYCQDLGYNVEVLITDGKCKEKPLMMFKNVKCFSMNLPEYLQAIQLDSVNKYKYVIFASAQIYYAYEIYGERFVLDYIENIKIPNEKIVLIEHHLDLLKPEVIKNYKVAALPIFSKEKNIKMVNPHYFCALKEHKKNKITKFVVTGSIETKRKNHNLIIEAIKTLNANNIDNYKITVIGDGTLKVKDKNVAEKIKFTGRLSYQKMYEEIQKSDYILGLFDPQNPQHDRYIIDGTSGTYQQIYGFLKPAIINEKFAAAHGLNETNSIIYSGNNLSNAMFTAINQSGEKYEEMKNKLRNLSRQIYQESLNNLEAFIGKNKGF